MKPYTELFPLLKNAFDPVNQVSEMPGSDICCHMVSFESQRGFPEWSDRVPFSATHNHHPVICDQDIHENVSFTYPVFIKGNQGAAADPVILLHGLNERSWVKYLSWAYMLVEQTHRPVILFPLAFHMNRSPLPWGNPRMMSPFLADRKERYAPDGFATVVNVALSDRLSDDPLRFYSSGLQSAADLMQLISQIRSGSHPMLKASSGIDFFAYSIGAFLAQILFIGNPGELFSKSRLFLFCGGSMFNDMNGVSRLIMDKAAFTALRKYYLGGLTPENLHSESLFNSLHHTELGKAFMSMLDLNSLKPYREARFAEIGKRMTSISLNDDKVIPAYHVNTALNQFSQVEILDFPFPYTHENPFPVQIAGSASVLDNSFRYVFMKASGFLS